MGSEEIKISVFRLPDHKVDRKEDIKITLSHLVDNHQVQQHQNKIPIQKHPGTHNELMLHTYVHGFH